MKRIIIFLMVIVTMMGLTGCDDTWHGDKKVDSYALVTTSSGNSVTYEGITYTNEVHTSQADAIAYPYELYLEADDTATIQYACTACDHRSVIEDVTAPAAFFFECDCITGDENPDMTEAMVINIILGTPPAEEG